MLQTSLKLRMCQMGRRICSQHLCCLQAVAPHLKLCSSNCRFSKRCKLRVFLKTNGQPYFLFLYLLVELLPYPIPIFKLSRIGSRIMEGMLVLVLVLALALELWLVEGMIFHVTVMVLMTSMCALHQADIDMLALGLVRHLAGIDVVMQVHRDVEIVPYTENTTETHLVVIAVGDRMDDRVGVEAPAMTIVNEAHHRIASVEVPAHGITKSPCRLQDPNGLSMTDHLAKAPSRVSIINHVSLTLERNPTLMPALVLSRTLFVGGVT